MPDYSFEGPGLKIDGVSAGKPAEKAGIQRGDIVLQVGDDAIGGMGDYMMVLGRHNPGDVVDVKVKRGEENLTLSLTF
jgi:S1-C subfamily serine protease